MCVCVCRCLYSDILGGLVKKVVEQCGLRAEELGEEVVRLMGPASTLVISNLHHYLLQAPFDVGGKAEGVEAEAMMVATGKEGYVLEVY